MTVGVAAVAGRDRTNRRADTGVPTEAIVLVADRRLTYGGDNSVTEAWIPKIRGMIGLGARKRTTWSALFAGEGSEIDAVKAIITRDRKYQRLHKARKPKLDDVADAVCECVAKVWARGFDEYVYEPFGLTRAEFQKRGKTLPESITERIAQRGVWFDESAENEFGVELALCGFDERRRSAVLEVTPAGKLQRHFDTGFCAIGEGCDTATARLELLRYQPWMDLSTVLYMAIDAKLTAERVASVGPTTDAWVLLPRRDLPVEVEPHLVKTLATVRRWLDSGSPFAVESPDEPLIEAEPEGWRDELWDFVKKCYRGSSKAVSSIEREQPSWLSRSVSRGTILRPAPAHLSVRPAVLKRLRQGSSRRSQQRRSERP
jgi:hypothetical protein